jgi:hypothetical protein
VQVALAASDPPDSTTFEPPAVALAEPPHVVTAFGVPATSTLVGSMSVSATPDKATELAAALASVIVSIEVPPNTIDAGENALVIVTGGATVSVAVADALLVTPWVVVTLDAATVLT